MSIATNKAPAICSIMHTPRAGRVSGVTSPKPVLVSTVMLAYKDGARVRLVSRNGRDHTRRFAGIAAAVAKLAARALVLDGEVAIYDQQLRSRFDWLREPDADAVATPPMFMAFDLLHQDGRELTGRPLRERRARLEEVVADNDLVLSVRRLASNGFQSRAITGKRKGSGDAR